MKIYISSVIDLADARFFSAYGVQSFGFCFDVLNVNAITIDKAKEIVSWLHEPKIIGQFGNHQTWEEMQYADAQLPLQAVQVSADHPELDKISKLKWISADHHITIENTSAVFISDTWTKESLKDVLSRDPYGIHISCSSNSNIESYAELMEIVEPYLLQ